MCVFVHLLTGMHPEVSLDARGCSQAFTRLLKIHVVLLWVRKLDIGRCWHIPLQSVTCVCSHYREKNRIYWAMGSSRAKDPNIKQMCQTIMKYHQVEKHWTDVNSLLFKTVISSWFQCHPCLTQLDLQQILIRFLYRLPAFAMRSVMIFNVRVLGLDVVKHPVISSRGDQFWSLAIVSGNGDLPKQSWMLECRCWSRCFTDIHKPKCDLSELSHPSTHFNRTQGNEWWLEHQQPISMDEPQILKDNGNITLNISQTESSNVVYNSQISWLLVSTLLATKGCRCQRFLQWYWFAETTVCARYLAMAVMHLAWGMQLQRGIKALNVVEVCWPMIAPVYTNWHKKPAEQSTDIQHQIPASHIFSHLFFEILPIPQEFHQLFGMTNPPPEVSTLCVSLLTKTRTRVLGLGAARSTVTFSAQQKGQDYHHFPFFNGNLGFCPPFFDISTYWMFKNLWILIRKCSERVLVIVIQSP